MSDAQQMRELLANLDHQQRERTDAYVDGFRDGWDVGYGHRIHEENAAWQAARMQRGPDLQGVAIEHRALDRAYAEGRPCNTPHASGCSRCIRAEAVARRGGDYQGGPVEWEPRQRSREVA